MVKKEKHVRNGRKAIMAEQSSTISEDKLKCFKLEFGPLPIFESPYLH